VELAEVGEELVDYSRVRGLLAVMVQMAQLEFKASYILIG
jgi:hypothetical protein